MSALSFLGCYARAVRRFAAARAPEVLVLQGSPLLGALFVSVTYDWFTLVRVVLLVTGSIALTAHVFVFNDWAGRSSDRNDSRRATRGFWYRGISSRQVASLAVALLVAAMLLFAVVGSSAALVGAAIAAISLIYSGSSSWGKGRPILASLLHLIGGTLHFLLGYTMSHAVDGRGVALGIFFGLVFAGGHLNQEVRDYKADLYNRIRTSAVVFGRRRIFLYSVLAFTTAYFVLALLVGLGVLARPLLLAMLFCPWHIACSVRAIRRGLSLEAVIWIQRRYRFQFALVGTAMLLTTPPVAELARRAREHASGPRDARFVRPSDALAMELPRLHN